VGKIVLKLGGTPSREWLIKISTKTVEKHDIYPEQSNEGIGMLQPRTLQQRLVFFLLLPVAILLFGIGLAGLFYARDALLEEFREAAILKLQRLSHDVDMRLREPKRWLEMYRETAGELQVGQVRQWLLERMRALPGVVRAEVVLPPPGEIHPLHGGSHMGQERRGEGSASSGKMASHRVGIAEVTPPRYDSLVDHETVGIISELIDPDGRSVGKVEAVLRFGYLIEHIVPDDRLRIVRLFLLDDTGRVLMCTGPRRHVLGDTNDPLELAILRAMEEKPFGTILGEGRPPREVGGFCRLTEAPWSIVVIAPGREILAPIITFRNYYMGLGGALILLVLVLIRLVTGRAASAIREVSKAAERVAHGSYSSLPVPRGRDEVAHLVVSFNAMMAKLAERDRLKQAMTLAMEIQQSLLPGQAPVVEGMDVAGTSIYCDETGGDYYDYLQVSKPGPGRLAVAVGDVTGHGISAALLMTTARAFLRSRAIHPGDLGQVVTDVNRLLAVDTSQAGNFMTLFVMLVDGRKGEIRWVRAGHDPAILYDPAADSFTELMGGGIALGVDETWTFEEQRHDGWKAGQVVLIGTDGIWESENPQGEMFGQERFREIVRRTHARTAQEVLAAITDAVDRFREDLPRQDDITLVVIKKR
jgi:sigma-B regulation protein RsbU (phosphoserine phosphatase)